jgi:hypothetical protein
MTTAALLLELAVLSAHELRKRGRHHAPSPSAPHADPVIPEGDEQDDMHLGSLWSNEPKKVIAPHVDYTFHLLIRLMLPSKTTTVASCNHAIAV